jgi:hypothetical protein
LKRYNQSIFHNSALGLKVVTRRSPETLIHRDFIEPTKLYLLVPALMMTTRTHIPFALSASKRERG